MAEGYRIRLDLGSQAVKAVELTLGGPEPVITGFARVGVPPGSDKAEALAEDAPPVLPIAAPGAPEPRVTLTARVLSAAYDLHVLITGDAKRAADGHHQRDAGQQLAVGQNQVSRQGGRPGAAGDRHVHEARRKASIGEDEGGLQRGGEGERQQDRERRVA